MTDLVLHLLPIFEVEKVMIWYLLRMGKDLFADVKLLTFLIQVIIDYVAIQVASDENH